MTSLATYKGAPRYRTNSDGTVSLIIGGKVASTFANKEEARAKVKDARTKMREANKMVRAIRKIPIKTTENGTTISYSNEGIKVEAAKAGISFAKMKRHLLHNAQREAQRTRRAAEDAVNTYTPSTSTTQTSSAVNKPMANSATDKVANAIQSSANAVNKRAGMGGKYGKKLRFK